MFLFEAETISNVTTSRSPPSSGEESADTAVSPPAELIRLFTVILLRTPASASLSSNSSFAGVTSPEVIVVLPVITVLSVSSCRNTVPLAFGKFIVLSAASELADTTLKKPVEAKAQPLGSTLTTVSYTHLTLPTNA